MLFCATSGLLLVFVEYRYCLTSLGTNDYLGDIVVR